MYEYAMSGMASGPASAEPWISSRRSSDHGRTLVHFSAQRERFPWDGGCMQGLISGCLEGVRGHKGASGVYFESETAQVELKSGRV